MFEALEAANSDDPGHEPADYEEWHRLMVDTYRYDRSLWWIAHDGEEIAGVALGVTFPDAGWVRLVGVRREFRRRGIAAALLRTAFGEFWHQGQRRVELGVDPDSEHRAQQLYERAGMQAAFELERYRRRLHQEG